MVRQTLPEFKLQFTVVFIKSLCSIEGQEFSRACSIYNPPTNISGKDNQYVYLMDIEAVTTKTGEKGRSFQMLLCFNSRNFAKLPVKALRKIVNECEENDGIWTGVKNKNNEETATSQKIIKRWTYKHNLSTAEDYAARVLLDLEWIGWD